MDIRPIVSTAQVAATPAEKTLPVVPHFTPVPAAPVAAAQQHSATPSSEQVAQAVKDINKAMQALSQDLEFSIDESSARTVVKVVDQTTREIIRQMPTKEALEIAEALDRVQGLLIRQKA
jgi:flagellar protein FlaG